MAKSIKKQFNSLITMRINLEKFLIELKTNNMGLSENECVSLKKEYEQLHNKIDKLTKQLVVNLI